MGSIDIMKPLSTCFYSGPSMNLCNIKLIVLYWFFSQTNFWECRESNPGCWVLCAIPVLSPQFLASEKFQYLQRNLDWPLCQRSYSGSYARNRYRDGLEPKLGRTNSPGLLRIGDPRMAPAATTPGAKNRWRFGQNLFRQRPTSRGETGLAAFLAGALKKPLLLK